MLSEVITPESVNEELKRHLSEQFDNAELAARSQQFRREGYVKLREIVPDTLFEAISTEVHRLLDLHAHRIDVNLRETENSPRYMSTVSSDSILRDSSLIPAVYHSPALMEFLSSVARQRVLPCPWDGEKYAILKQHKKGDTHGWHWGDFSFAAVWIIEAPDLTVGGALQCVPHTDWDKSDPRVMQYLLDNPIRTYGNVKRDVYFLRTDTTLHRTIPLSEDRTRIILNTTWASEEDQNKETTHETMHQMFQ